MCDATTNTDAAFAVRLEASEVEASGEYVDLRGVKPARSETLSVGVGTRESSNDGVPPALRTFSATSPGRDALDIHVCNQCGASDPKYRCRRCGIARYCGSACQRDAWLKHKPECRRVARPVDAAPTSVRSVCARCLVFDKSKLPADLASRFTVVGEESLADNYGTSPEDRGLYAVKERGVQRNRWKCSCRGCNKVWWCVQSLDPDGVFDTVVAWTATAESFKSHPKNHGTARC